MIQVVRTERSVVNVDYVLGMGGYDLTRVEADVEKATTVAHSHAHDHAHDRAHDHAHDHECSGADCSHESHRHHEHEHDCSGADCSHESHSHGSHSHSHEHDHDCSGADCSHESHNHGTQAVPQVNTSVHDDQIGSISFVIDGDMDLDKVCLTYQEPCHESRMQYTLYILLQVNYWLGGIVELRGEDIYRMKGVLSIRDFEQRFVFHVRAIRVRSEIFVSPCVCRACI